MRPRFLILMVAAAFVLGIASTVLVMHQRTGAPTAAASHTEEAAAKQPLYWYDPMVPQQHFDHPGKSPYMDMQLVPKYADAVDEGPGTVRIDPRLVQNLGVRTGHVTRSTLAPMLRVAGTIAFDERSVVLVQARVAGIVERLDVRAPLTLVTAGQPLLTLLAPDWTSAQEEYLSLRRARSNGLEGLRRAARQRLLLLGMSEGQIRAIERNGHAQTRITVTAPQDGVVSELSVREGATVTAGSPLLRLNGLDPVWIDAAIPESQTGRVAAGDAVTAEVPAFPGTSFKGTIEAVLPDLDTVTRTQTARIVMANPQGRLAPGMFAKVAITPSASAEQLLVPSEAVIATGTRQVVIVDAGQGRFRAQEVRIGDEGDGNSVVLDGLHDGETVVLSGQFLIDSEASLTGTLARLGGPRGEHAAKAATPPNGSPP
ncbi:efflux RND transporter periplasmic adaptor subunit [Dokdonella soli]|uniref:Efflux RND transporter periplasmic adaptor subunit n=1 Tax=Dokdonella soli TaxID=529810 RepID=A0ABP3U1B8_9GAMM